MDTDTFRMQMVSLIETHGVRSILIEIQRYLEARYRMFLETDAHEAKRNFDAAHTLSVIAPLIPGDL